MDEQAADAAKVMVMSSMECACGCRRDAAAALWRCECACGGVCCRECARVEALLQAWRGVVDSALSGARRAIRGA